MAHISELENDTLFMKQYKRASKSMASTFYSTYQSFLYKLY